MNRRHLVLGIALGSFAEPGSRIMALSREPGSRVMALSREPGSAMREFNDPGGKRSLRVSVADFLEDDIAGEQWHRLSSLALALFEETLSETSGWVSRITPPPALDAFPCAIALRTTVSGAAAVEASAVIGTLRRGSVVWKVSSWGEKSDNLVTLAQDVLIHLKDLGIQSFESGRNELNEKTGGLWDLVPSAHDLPTGFVTIQQTAPSPEIHFPK
ncbi:MAG TPA: hypothetical protein VNZ58_09110 [Thermomicrobiales bacterium]|nr:hypothetical protein [Thermomicrobiales bacterium]